MPKRKTDKDHEHGIKKIDYSDADRTTIDKGDFEDLHKGWGPGRHPGVKDTLATPKTPIPGGGNGSGNGNDSST